MKKITYTLLLLILSMNVRAQRALIVSYDDVVKLAKSELDSSMQQGALKEFALKSSIKGEYVLDITIHEKGTVLTVFAVSNDTDDMKMQTRLKDFVRTLEFSFKMPKGKNYKFQYTFHFQ